MRGTSTTTDNRPTAYRFVFFQAKKHSIATKYSIAQQRVAWYARCRKKKKKKSEHCGQRAGMRNCNWGQGTTSPSSHLLLYLPPPPAGINHLQSMTTLSADVLGAVIKSFSCSDSWRRHKKERQGENKKKTRRKKHRKNTIASRQESKKQKKMNRGGVLNPLFPGENASFSV